MSSNYYEVSFSFSDTNADEIDILSALLADYGYDSFEAAKDGLNAYINEDLYDESNVKKTLNSYCFRSKITYTKSLIKSDDWNREWEKNSFTPIVIGNECVVHATYHTDYPRCKYDIVIDPKMSFGSGHHETTSMLIGRLLEMNLQGVSVIDMGTGTGILSIIAAKLGAKSVTGIEIDEGVYKNACENCRLNDVTVKVMQGDASILRNVEKCDLFIANINRNIIISDIEKYVMAMNRGAMLMISGFYEEDLQLLITELKKFGLTYMTKKVSNGWTMAEFRLMDRA